MSKALKKKIVKKPKIVIDEKELADKLNQLWLLVDEYNKLVKRAFRSDLDFDTITLINTSELELQETRLEELEDKLEEIQLISINNDNW